jgi:hypothetical protein
MTDTSEIWGELTALDDMVSLSENVAQQALKSLLTRLQFTDLTPSEAVAMLAILRPAHERVCAEYGIKVPPTVARPAPPQRGRERELADVLFLAPRRHRGKR